MEETYTNDEDHAHIKQPTRTSVTVWMLIIKVDQTRGYSDIHYTEEDARGAMEALPKEWDVKYSKYEYDTWD